MLDMTHKHNGSHTGVIIGVEQFELPGELVSLFHVEWDYGPSFSPYPGRHLELIARYEDDEVL